MADTIATWIGRHLSSRTEFTTDVVDVREADLPMSELGAHERSPIAGRLADADGFLVVTPEYNHSFPAALKNLIDWHVEEWARKPVAFVSYGAASGGLRAVEHLRQVFAELYAVTMRNSVALSAPWERLDADGNFTPDRREPAALDATLDELAWWATALRAARRQPN